MPTQDCTQTSIFRLMTYTYSIYAHTYEVQPQAHEMDVAIFSLGQTLYSLLCGGGSRRCMFPVLRIVNETST